MTSTIPNNSAAGHPDDLPIMHGPSGPIGTAAFVLGLFSLLLLFFHFGVGGFGLRDIGPHEPPSIIAVNLSFCALLFGIATIYRVRRMPRQGLIRAAGILAALMGLAGPAIYARQALNWRVRMEHTELAHADTIAHAAAAWATAHDGTFPPSLSALVAAHDFDPDALHSPFGPQKPIPSATSPDAEEKIDQASDYVYMGGDLHGLADHSKLAPQILTVVSRETRLKDYLTVAFADGRATFIRHDQIAATWGASNAARKTLGLGPMTAPAAATQPVLPGQ